MPEEPQILYLSRDDVEATGLSIDGNEAVPEAAIDYVPLETSTTYDHALFSYLTKRKRLG